MKHFRHRSAGSTIEIFFTLGRVLKQRVVEELRKSKAFGLLVDEVTDISVMEQLIGFAQYGRFPFNPKVRKFRMVHQMEWTISVWSNRNIRDQL